MAKLKYRVDYSTHSTAHKSFSRIMEFNDQKHADNFFAKSNREGKKIISMDLIEDEPYNVVYVLNADDIIGDQMASLRLARELGDKYFIKEFERTINNSLENLFTNCFIYFANEETR